MAPPRPIPPRPADPDAAIAARRAGRPDPANEAEAFEAAARELGAHIDYWGGIVPFQIEGTVFDRNFYLRCRHELWSVKVAPDEDPLGDPLDPDRVTFEVAAGVEDDFDDGSGRHYSVVALHLAVQSIEDFFRRRRCAHTMADSLVRFCPYCGVRLSEAERWR